MNSKTYNMPFGDGDLLLYVTLGAKKASDVWTKSSLVDNAVENENRLKIKMIKKTKIKRSQKRKMMMKRWVQLKRWPLQEPLDQPLSIKRVN